MQSESWFSTVIRGLFGMIDGAIYSLIGTLYQILLYISNMTLFNDANLADFRGRVYTILGIFMLFKVTFSLIGLFMNPDQLTDSQKGINGIVKRILISLVLITIVPTVFQTAMRIQGIVLQENIIGNFFLGSFETADKNASGGESATKSIDAETFRRKAGRIIAFQVLEAFYRPYDSLKRDYTTEPFVPEKGKDAITVKNAVNIDTTDGGNDHEGADADDNEISGGTYFYYVTNYSYNISEYLSWSDEQVGPAANASGEGYYGMKYDIILSTVAGVVVAWMFLGFCIDAAVRVVKLSVLQLMAPIPVFSYIDPKSEKAFNNWIKECISTYLSLFIRLASIFLAIYVIYLFQKNGILQYNSQGNIVTVENADAWVGTARVFIYIGILLFVKDLPKMISDIFGISMQSSFGTKLAKTGIIGTGLVGATAGLKILGEGYKGVQRRADIGNLERQKNKLDTERDADKISAINEQQAKIREGMGLKNTGRALMTGFGAGVATGYKSKGKFNLGESLSRANTTQKRREGNIGIRGDIKSALDKKFDVVGQWGESGTVSNKIKSYKNGLQRNQIAESRTAERLMEDIIEANKKFGFNSDDYNKFSSFAMGNYRGEDGKEEPHFDFGSMKELQDKMIEKSLNSKTSEITSKRNSLQELFDKKEIKEKEFRERSLSLTEELDSYRSDLESTVSGIYNSSHSYNNLDSSNKRIEKEIGKLEKQLRKAEK